jgi:hypothetical protein
MNTAFRIDDRGVARGLGAVLLAVTIYVTLTRFGQDWKAFPEFLISALAAGAVLFLALRHRGHSDARDHAGRGPGGIGAGAGPGAGGAGGAGAVAVGGPEAGAPGAHGHAAPSATPEDDRHGWVVPPGWQSAMLVSGFVLSAIALVFLADLLGADAENLASGTVTWVSLVLAIGFAAIALRTGSAICIFLAALAAVTMVLAAIDWIFSPEEPDTYRWILLLLTIGLFAAGAMLYRQRPRHGTVVVVVGGLTLLSLGFILAAESLGGAFLGGGEGGAPDGAGTGWELVILIGAVALTLFAIVTREPGPGYVAAFVLLTFVALVAEPNDDDASLIGWPIILLVLAAAALAAGFRPGGDDHDGGHRDRGAGGGGPVVAGPRDDPGDTTREVRL